MNEYVDTNGTKTWFKNGLRHREDGPAVEWYNGPKEWYKNGKRHRKDGPALIYPNGLTEWFLNNKEYTKDEFIFLQFTKGIIINE